MSRSKACCWNLSKQLNFDPHRRARQMVVRSWRAASVARAVPPGAVLAQRQAIDLIARLRRIADETIGVPLAAHQAARLTGGRDVFVQPHDVGNPDRRQRRQDLARLVTLDDRTEVRPIGRLNRPRIRTDVLVAGQHPVAARRVRVVVGRHRSDDRQLVGHRGSSRQQLAELDAGNVGADRIERTADVGGCVRLWVKCFVLRRPAG